MASLLEMLHMGVGAPWSKAVIQLQLELTSGSEVLDVACDSITCKMP